jgi:hypothetical protein
MTDNGFLVFSIAGFIVSLITLVYFILLYKQTDEEILQTEPDLHAQKPAADEKAPNKLLSDIQEQIEDFQKRIDEAKYLIKQEKNLQQNQIDNIVSEINGLVARIEKLDSQAIRQVETPLNDIINELETIRKLQSD